VQELQARSAEENDKPYRGRVAYAMSMPSRPIILPIFAVVVRSNLLEEHIVNSFRPGLMQIILALLPCP
jgi:hypothetical protein